MTLAWTLPDPSHSAADETGRRCRVVGEVAEAWCKTLHSVARTGVWTVCLVFGPDLGPGSRYVATVFTRLTCY